MTDLGAYSGLFLSAFVAATLLPTASEAVLVSLLAKLGALDAAHPMAQKRLPAPQRLWATLIINRAIGLYGQGEDIGRRFP